MEDLSVKVVKRKFQPVTSLEFMRSGKKKEVINHIPVHFLVSH